MKPKQSPINPKRTELVIGCGSRKHKDIVLTGDLPDFNNPTFLDYNPSHKPDVVWDLNQHPLPFANNSFDEIHAYEVLEHLGRQGDYKFFFSEWSEYWRILKPNGLFFGSVPMRMSPWAWGDPSHTRIITPEQFVFLNQDAYEEQVGHTAMSDFRSIYNGHFTVYSIEEDKRSMTMFFILQAGRKLHLEGV